MGGERTPLAPSSRHRSPASECGFIARAKIGVSGKSFRHAAVSSGPIIPARWAMEHITAPYVVPCCSGVSAPKFSTSTTRAKPCSVSAAEAFRTTDVMSRFPMTRTGRSSGSCMTGSCGNRVREGVAQALEGFVRLCRSQIPPPHRKQTCCFLAFLFWGGSEWKRTPETIFPSFSCDRNFGQDLAGRSAVDCSAVRYAESRGRQGEALRVVHL
jgi:hypothetical protein